MAHWSGSVEFDFVGDEESGQFVATTQVIPQLGQMLAAGDVEGAVRLYEGCDAQVAQELLAGAKNLSSVSQRNLGQMFVLARDFASAAQVFVQGRRWAEAARTFEQAGNFVEAARCYEKENDLPKAAAALERAGRGSDAVELYRKAGTSEALAECLSRQRRYWEAAQVYHELSHVRGEVEALRLVPTSDPQRIAAVKRLGDLLEQHGHIAPAAQLLVETLQQLPESQKDPELLSALIRRMEVMGQHDKAAKVRAFAQRTLSGRPGGMPAQLAGRVEASTVRVEPVEDAPLAAPAPSRSASADPFDSLVDPFGGSPIPASAEEAKRRPGPDPFAGAVDPVVASGPRARQSSDAYGYLKAIPIFGELALEDMKDLYRLCEAALHQPGATVIEQGVQGKGLTVILQGQVQVLRVDPNRSLPLASLGAGSYVGEISLVDDAPTSARVVAQTEVKALFVSRQRFEQYLYTHEAAALKIYTLFTKTLAERLRLANRRS